MERLWAEKQTWKQFILLLEPFGYFISDIKPYPSWLGKVDLAGKIAVCIVEALNDRNSNGEPVAQSVIDDLLARSNQSAASKVYTYDIPTIPSDFTTFCYVRKFLSRTEQYGNNLLTTLNSVVGFTSQSELNGWWDLRRVAVVPYNGPSSDPDYPHLRLIFRDEDSRDRGVSQTQFVNSYNGSYLYNFHNGQRARMSIYSVQNDPIWA